MMNSYLVSIHKQAFYDKVMRGEFCLQAFGDYKLPEDKEHLHWYFKTKFNNDPDANFFIIWAAEGLIQQIFNVLKLDWRHEYIWEWESYKIIRSELPIDEVLKKINNISRHVGILVYQYIQYVVYNEDYDNELTQQMADEA